jgi:sec-independent protein translocase protein TatA
MNAMLGLFNVGGGELIIILVVILLLFGAKKVPELMRGMGQGIKEFKKATREVTDEMQNAMNDNPPPQKTIPPATVPNQTQPTVPQSPPGQKA